MVGTGFEYILMKVVIEAVLDLPQPGQRPQLDGIQKHTTIGRRSDEDWQLKLGACAHQSGCNAQREIALGIAPGLMSTCAELELPVFIGAPADGSVFLNSVKLWTLARLGKIKYGFDYDLHEDVFESCAYHHWGLFDSEAKTMAVLTLGGGVPKNYSLQPEPTLSQIFFLENIRGYDYDAQIVSSPVTDGSLSSCAPAEAVSWGKVDPETYTTQTVSMQGDYSSYMPFIVRALVGKELLHNPPQPLRLYAKRDELKNNLLETIGNDESAMEKIMETLSLPAALKI